jgi:hypothetical protein
MMKKSTTKNLLLILFFLMFCFDYSLFAQGAGLDKYGGSFGDKELRHLLRRTMFGATLEDMKHFKGKSMDVVLDELLDNSFAIDTPRWHLPYSDKFGNPDQFKPGGTYIGTPAERVWTVSGVQDNISYWWAGRMMRQKRSIKDKMLLFYENHLPSNNGKNVQGQGKFFYDRVKKLYDHTLGNYSDLIKEITIDPAMLFYLDNNFNFATTYLNGTNPPKPLPTNENYARELQEIYTVGKGRFANQQYFTEDDVKAASQILTGWCVCNNNDGNVRRILCKDTVNYKVSFTPSLHSKNDKSFSSFYNNKVIKYRSGDNGGKEEINELVEMLLSKRESAENLARKLYRFFVYGQISDDAEINVIQPLAEILLNGINGGRAYDLKPALRILLSSKHFYDKEQIGCMIKNPYDFGIGLIRMLGPTYYSIEEQHPVSKSLQLYSQYIYGYTTVIGWGLGGVPDVAGFPAYYQEPDYHKLWIDAVSLRKRKEMIHYVTPINTYGLLTIGRNLFGFNNDNKPLIVEFATRLQNPRDIDGFIQQNIDYFLVQDLTAEEKEILKKKLNPTTNEYINAWNLHDQNIGDFAWGKLYHRLREFYDVLFSYAEFQLM